MKIIDLLNKIANGEIPKRIKKGDKIYVADDNNYFSNMYIDENNNSHRLLLDFIPSLNDEVEVIKEDKKIEKIEYSIDKDGYLSVNDFREHLLQIINKINEIIDKMNTENMFNKEMALKIHEIIDKMNKE